MPTLTIDPTNGIYQPAPPMELPEPILELGDPLLCYRAAKATLTPVQLEIWLLTVRFGLNSEEIFARLSVEPEFCAEIKTPQNVRYHRGECRIKMHAPLLAVTTKDVLYTDHLHSGADVWDITDTTEKGAIEGILRRA